MKIIYYNENGFINGASINKDPDPTRLWVESDVTPSARLSSEYYVFEGAVILRPELILNERYYLLINEEVTITNIPANTEIYNDMTHIGISDGTDILLSFDVADNYYLKFKPPFPYKEKTIQVSVE